MPASILVFFRAESRFMQRLLPVGSTRYVSGRLEQYSDAWQMPHPDYIVEPEKRDTLPRLEPVYPLTAGLVGQDPGEGRPCRPCAIS